MYGLVFISLFLSTQVLKTGAVCKAGYAYKRQYSHYANSTLVGKFIKSFTARDEEHCEFECFWTDKNNCYKFNYHNVSKLCGLMYRSIAGSYRIQKSVGNVVKIRKCRGRSCHKSTQCFLLGHSNTVCQCPPPLNTTSCTDEGWLKVNTDPVCFGAKDSSFGTVIIPYDGKMSSLKLVHISGGVSSIESAPQGYWGTGGSRLNQIEIIVTDNANTTITPPEDYHFDEKTSKTTYKLEGFTTVSPEIVLPVFTLRAINGHELRVWLIEDFANVTEMDNSGFTCADVYMMYDY